jgi:hypothetical protein
MGATLVELTSVMVCVLVAATLKRILCSYAKRIRSISNGNYCPAVCNTTFIVTNSYTELLSARRR